MITREELGEMREDVVRRRDELMARAEELRARFVESADRDDIAIAFGLSLLGTGVALGITQAVRGRRRGGSIVAFGLAAAGLYLAGRAALNQRSDRIFAAERRVTQELASLDPIAKARVLRDVAADELPFIRRARS